MVARFLPKLGIRLSRGATLAAWLLLIALVLCAARPMLVHASTLSSCPDPRDLLPPGGANVSGVGSLAPNLPPAQQDEIGYEATYDGGSLRLELDRFKTLADASYIYDQLTNGAPKECGPASIGERSVQCPTTVYFVRGRYVVSVTNANGDPLSAHALDLARQADAAIQAIPASQNQACNTGQAPTAAAPFSVGSGCGYNEKNAPGELRCAAFVSNASANPVITYQWAIDGQPQPEQGKSLVRDDPQIPAGTHTVTVVATDSGVNPSRKTQINTYTFTKPGVAVPAAATTRGAAARPAATATRATAPSNKSGSADAGTVLIPDGAGGVTEVPVGGKATVSLPQDGKASVEAVCKNAGYHIALMDLVYDASIGSTLDAMINGRKLTRAQAIVWVLALLCNFETSRIEPRVPGNAALVPPNAASAGHLSIQLQDGPMRFDLQRKDIALDVSTPLGVVVSQGQNSFGVGYDGLSGNLVIQVYEGSVELQPANSSQKGRTLAAGDGVQVTKDDIKALAGMGEGTVVDKSSAVGSGLLCGCGALLLIPVVVGFVLLRRRSKKRRGRVAPAIASPVNGQQPRAPQPVNAPAQNQPGSAHPPARRFCSYCGAPLDLNARFCAGCGKPCGG